MTASTTTVVITNMGILVEGTDGSEETMIPMPRVKGDTGEEAYMVTVSLTSILAF